MLTNQNHEVNIRIKLYPKNIFKYPPSDNVYIKDNLHRNDCAPKLNYLRE